jgi:hypothetical protein
MATWLNPMSFARSSITPLSTRQGHPATAQAPWALSGTAGIYGICFQVLTTSIQSFLPEDLRS